MRIPARGGPTRARDASTYSAPAPIRGWNARDGVADMAVGFAGRLENWFPTSSDAMLRKGSTNYTTGLPSQVETLAAYKPLAGTEAMFAFSGTAAYAVVSGTVGAAVISSLTNARWQHVNFTTSAGNYLYLVNGVDKPQLWNGTSWVAVDGVSSPAITGVTTTTLINIAVHKERLWFVQANTLDLWYLPVQSVGGAAVKFPLGSVFKKGGYIMACGSWTMDSGTGPDDLFVIITSEGEVAVYQGTDPASANTWGLTGIFNIGTPIGRRCLMKFGGDLLILTTDGVVPASKALLAGRTTPTIATSDNISGAVTDAVNLYAGTFGWSMTQYPEGNMILLNVPVAAGSQEQYVMNSTTQAWCKFTAWDANCFEVFNGDLYFGGSTVVTKAWTGTDDNGANIVGELITAFDYFRNRTGEKQVTMIRPVIGWDSNPASFVLGIDTDFIITTPTSTVAFAAGVGGAWDTGTWDSAFWGGSVAYNKDWHTAFGNGYALAAHLIVSSADAQVRLAAFDYTYKRGAVL